MRLVFCLLFLLVSQQGFTSGNDLAIAKLLDLKIMLNNLNQTITDSKQQIQALKQQIQDLESSLTTSEKLLTEQKQLLKTLENQLTQNQTLYNDLYSQSIKLSQYSEIKNYAIIGLGSSLLIAIVYALLK